MKKKAFLVVGMGFEVVVLLWVFVYIGQKGDAYFQTGGWITSGLVILALFVWFYQLVKVFRE